MKKVILFISYFYIINLIAQDNLIQGKVVDTQQNPLESVNILIENNSQGTTTDADGRFELSTNLPSVTLWISNMSFEKQKLEVDLGENNTTFLTITLHPKTYSLEEVVVNSTSDFTENSLIKARKEQKMIPGATNVVVMEQLKNQRSLTLKDALVLQPGVMIQEFFGANDQPRLNIRGSGIQSNPQRRGINLLQDGISMNFADGSYIIGVLEPRAAEYIQVFRGANALKYGASTLGGAINLVSKNGYNTSPLEVKIEGGSYGYMGGSVSSGFVKGKTDGFANISYNRAKGFTKYNSSSRLNATLNIGRKFSENFVSRLYATYTDLGFDISGPITQKQLEKDPTIISAGFQPPLSIGPNVVRDQPRRDSKVLRFANRNTYKIDRNTNVYLGVYYQNADDTFVFPVPVGVRTSLSNDFGGYLNLNKKAENNEVTLGINAGVGYMNRQYYINMRGKKGKQYANNDLMASNFVFFAEGIYKFTEKFSAIANIQLSFNQRNNTDIFPNPNRRPFYNFKSRTSGVFSAKNTTLNQKYVGFNPKLGVIYDFNPNHQVFFNVSRSYEPPTFDELINQGGGNPFKSPSKFYSVKLAAQRATTLELGGRGNGSYVHWDISLYRSWIKGEILTTTDLFGISGSTRNSKSPTIHQGVELGLGFTLLENIFTENKDKLLFNSVYNFSDFYFERGIYKNKQIAGIPKHYIAGALEYKNPEGISIAFNTEWLPEKTPTDHQNTVYQQPYYLLGCRLRYSKNKWGIFVEGKNLTNQKYASSYLIRDVVANPRPPKITSANVTTFIPGQGINIIGGVYYKL